MSSAPRLVFADTTVLINFGLCDAVPLLQEIIGDRGTWTQTIRGECRRKERDYDIVGTADAVEVIFGQPLRPDDDEHRQVRALRASMSKPNEHPDKHLGEAEYITIIEQRRISALIVTDDHDVSRHTGAPCITSWDLIGLGVRKKVISDSTARDMRDRLLAQNRVHVAEIRDPSRFEAWLADKLGQ